MGGTLLAEPAGPLNATSKISEPSAVDSSLPVTYSGEGQLLPMLTNAEGPAEATSSKAHPEAEVAPKSENMYMEPSLSNGLSLASSSKSSHHLISTDSQDTGSQTTNGGYQEQDTFTDNHDTPNGSMTSASLISPLLPAKSASPSTQLNHALSSASSSSTKTNQNGVAHTPDYSRYRPRSSIPSKLSASLYAQQCVAAARASRLNPYALHKSEKLLLQDHLCHLHVTVYLNIRNGILRLWTRNPMVSVTKDEALGCAKDYRWMNLASFAYDWLVRNGYINFGCVDIPKTPVLTKRGRKKEGPTIVIIGAGMAGLGCARQLQALFQQYRDNSSTPKLVILEGRKRIGGRIYSHPLQSLKSNKLAKGLRSTAEMGAQIIVGFDHGNPLDPIIRAQLALRYHLLRDISTIYDIDGSPIDELQDAMAEKLYNDILDRSGTYRHKAVVTSVAEGDREMIDSGRDLSANDGITIRQYEEATTSGTIDMLLPAKRLRRGVGHKTADIKTSAGVQLSDLGATGEHSAALACKAMGWKLRPGVSSRDTISLDKIAKASKTQTLGAVMNDGVRQYQNLLPLTPKDMRLVNWHFANLEYANAANLGKLSLRGWDQDMGNEFEGEHAQVIGGYQQVPRGLWLFPTQLDVRPNKAVTSISYDPQGRPNQKAHIHCEDGETVIADKVIVTTPLGVLKKKSVAFVPPLPDWKTGAIDRLGFGTMNKVILVFERSFWDEERDMFGLLREPTTENSLSQNDYIPNRGKFYLFWNCIRTSGLPMLIALMAGDSAHQAEATADADILTEVMSQLRNIFKEKAIPDPLETIITRWGTDRFAQGSYSYVGAEARPGDYDLMAKPIGNLFFAGEATCGTHPATVHGAYLSGLRAASEVLESIMGPIEINTPLVPSKAKTGNNGSPAVLPTASAKTTPATGKKRKQPPSAASVAIATPQTPTQAPSNNSFPSKLFIKESYDKAMWDAIISELGPAEPRPAKLALNPFLLYQKDYWHPCKARCDESRRKSMGNPEAKAPRDEIRQALGQMWREASEEIRKPYLAQIDVHRRTNEEGLAKWKERISDWERKTYEVKDRWCAANPLEDFEARLIKGHLERVENGSAVNGKMRKIG
ncbi:hypothetical protein AJ80_03471 [Polytolypa hystricis UAMH7299]|uniref:SWIRM domain-containing protein n=1 Tax=Polytolypa hystricis (strain UAMH7299) TaxID=1447883 RepID=A0A2B7YI65_POLH7|nr:hypothetical protein AJ80_03471 [Polytolypa hystricis UAMH7299]